MRRGGPSCSAHRVPAARALTGRRPSRDAPRSSGRERILLARESPHAPQRRHDASPTPESAEHMVADRQDTQPAAEHGRLPQERRRNPRLRELVDEMLASLRVAAQRELWTEVERRQYEAELAEVMQRVRFEAVWKGPPASAQPGAVGGAKERAGLADAAASPGAAVEDGTS
jgi:hypothetical protein